MPVSLAAQPFGGFQSSFSRKTGSERFTLFLGIWTGALFSFL
jgi:hypothetical protein